MKLLVILVSLGLVACTPVPEVTTATQGPDMAEPPVRRTLNDMFEEVEELVEDTQNKLEHAVKELEAEQGAAGHLSLKDLPPNYHNKTVKETKVGNATIVTEEEVVRETDNKTGSTYISKTIVSKLKHGDKEGHECIVDEDCSPGNYCHLSSLNYRCLRCKEEEACTRDGECCEGRQCVWGQCRTSSRGQSGTICESQQDCGPGLCCAVHTSLLFPVCTPLPGKGEQCQTPDPFLELFTWELESEVPVNRCPCPSGLVCQPQSPGLVSVCEEASVLHTAEEDASPISPAPQEQIVYEDGPLGPTGHRYDLQTSEDAIDTESELPQPQFIDFI
ncbi:dickkopf-related protein 3 [Dendropsophus ebraccatus]|uniref:dickkopf-related protein 3 n=1 Tax=Dendropsophus ebraccatus TaxID=150705 RepID=UPI00383211C7